MSVQCLNCRTKNLLVGVGPNKDLEHPVEELSVGVAGLVSDGSLDEPDEVLLAPAEGLLVEDEVLDRTGGINIGGGGFGGGHDGG